MAEELRQVMPTDEAARVGRLLAKHLTGVMDGLRVGLSPDSIAALTGLPRWMVIRIGRDAHLLPVRG